MIFLNCRDLDQLAITTTTTEGNDEVDSVISNDSLDKYEQRMNAECDMNPPKEENRRSGYSFFFFFQKSLKIYISINKNPISL